MGNKVSNPLPAYDSIAPKISAGDMQLLTERFYGISGGKDSATLEDLQRAARCPPAIREGLVRRIHAMLDARKGGLQIEDYVSAVALTWFGSRPDLVRFLFVLYNERGTGHLNRDELVALLSDAAAATLQAPAATTREHQRAAQPVGDLLQLMADMALAQYATHSDSRLSLNEFTTFVQVEPDVNAVLDMLPALLDAPPPPAGTIPNTAR
mmetsp:Transcript_5745/g.19280  ORF Transcript_5745/g.19280 Transcript_5745/m.19280 type:complete len:210 (+) Transcript_5745:96-725(+)